MIIDAGPLIDADRGALRLAWHIKTAIEKGHRVVTNHNVVAQVVRNPARQANLMRLLNRIEIHEVGNGAAVGLALASSGTSDVVDASLAVMAQSFGPVLTSDIGDFAKFSVPVIEYR